MKKGWYRVIDFSSLGRILIIFGLILAGLGFLLLLAGKIPWIGRLPGDFYYKGKNVTIFFPLATSLLVSIILTLILWLINRK